MFLSIKSKPHSFSPPSSKRILSNTILFYKSKTLFRSFQFPSTVSCFIVSQFLIVEMADFSFWSTQMLLLQVFVAVSLFRSSLGGRILSTDDGNDFETMRYHNGPLLSGQISMKLIWYGKFKPSQRAIVSDFFNSIYSTKPQTQPSVSGWWKTTEKYYHLAPQNKPSSLQLTMDQKEILDENYSLGRSLTSKQIVELAARGGQKNAINIVLTASDVAVEGFCSSRCGTHGPSSSTWKSAHLKNKNYKFAYIWVGNSEIQCPGQCAWPFHQPIYGPQSSPLGAPNGDVGMDGMVINLSSLLAATATNPFGSGYFQGPADAPLEAASACPGVYGKGAYPGYAGDLLLDSTTGASYNANGADGRKYLLPALFDPSTSSCSTFV